MWKFSRVLLPLSAVVLFFLGSATCQIHYVPAQILIPTLNISHFNTTSNNFTHGGQVPIARPIAQAPNVPPGVGWMINSNSTNAANNKTFWLWNQTTANGDLVIGQIGYLDHLLFKQEYFKPRRWWSSRDKTIEYPKNYGRHEIISAIRVYNKFYDGLDSKARVVSGGIGHRYVKIEISSKWGKGFKYDVQLFGH